jgi:DNA primase
MTLVGASGSRDSDTGLPQLPAVLLMLDSDQAGQTAASEIAQRLTENVWVRRVNLKAGRQPINCLRNCVNCFET